MEIGIKIKELRLKKQLTQEELADRCELTKGYISQIENDLTSPSIATLTDILTSLGTTLAEFFGGEDDEKIVFTSADHFEKDNGDSKIVWLVPTSQKNEMEPIIMELNAGASTSDLPHEGEEFGYVMDGEVKIEVGKTVSVCKKGESFYYRASRNHRLTNEGESKCVIMWVSCPPNF